MWNTIGIQGSRLIQVLDEPIYLDNVVVEGHAPESLERGIDPKKWFDFLKKEIPYMDEFFRLNSPSIVSIDPKFKFRKLSS